MFAPLSRSLRQQFSPQHFQVRHASFSLPNLKSLFPSRSAKPDSDSSSSTSAPSEPEAGKGLFDLAQESEAVLSRPEARAREKKKATFVRTSVERNTANFKTSRRKLNDLGRLIVGRTADEGVLQLQVSPKKPASRLLSMLALARDHAIAKGMNRDKLVIAQSWTSQGPSLKRLDIKGRGRRGIKHHPSSKLHILLAEGETEEERRRQRKKDQWRASVRGLCERDGTGVGKARPMINVAVGGWKW
ncbi:large subunit ribosomal protein L22, partial [Phenoliferia sp. Uapishka_3]